MPKQPQSPNKEDYGFVADEAPKSSGKENYGFVEDAPSLHYKGRDIPVAAGLPVAAFVPEAAGEVIPNLASFVKSLVGKPSNVGSTGGLVPEVARVAVPEAEAAATGPAGAIKRLLVEKLKHYGPAALGIKGVEKAWDFIKDAARD